MLSDLSESQSSDEQVWGTRLSLDVETRSEDGGELVRKTYTFSWAKEWDKWVFHSYREERTPDTTAMRRRNWQRSRHITWDDPQESRTINVPPEVATELHRATGGAPVTIQVPAGGIDTNEYDTIKRVE